MAQKEKTRVGLVFGGCSAEHEISIRSARSVAAAIDRTRFDLTLIGIDRRGRWLHHSPRSFAALTTDASEAHVAELVPHIANSVFQVIGGSPSVTSEIRVDVVFPVVHGPYGEDGTLQGLLEMAGIPYVGAGVLGSAVGMDKDVQKRLLREAGIPVVDFATFRERDWRHDPAAVRERLRHLGGTVFVKPANLGSSVGITKVRREQDLDPAIEVALSYDTKIIVETGIVGREIECSVLGNDDPRASLPGEIVPGEDFYSYDDKYLSGSAARLVVPAELAPEVVAAIQKLAVRAFQATECCGMARVDFFLEGDSRQIYVNELNTIPGFTSISMYPKLWEASGLTYSDLISRLIDLALERHAARRRLPTRSP